MLNNGEQEGAVILCPFVERAVLEEGKYIQLGFDAEDIANYMAREIENNLKSAKAYEIKTLSDADRYIDKELLESDNIKDIFRSSLMISAYQNNYTGIVAAKYGMFYDAVKKDSFWDHKWQLSNLFPSMGLSRRFYHVYRDKDIPYDVWSNIHFGVVGKYCSFSEDTLLDGADVAQIKDTFKPDTDEDKKAITIGYNLYKNCFINHITITDNHLLSEIIKYKLYYINGECKK